MGARQCVIATETGRHLEDALAALECGFDLLVEKPLDLDASRAKQLCDAVATTGRTAFTAFVLRFSPSLNRVRELLPRIGTIHAVRIECQSYLPEWRPDRPYRDSYSARERDGGVLRDLSHELDYACWLFGWPSSVYGRLQNTGRLEIQADESADMTWLTPSHASVSIRIDYLTRQPRRRMIADGDEGSLWWDGLSDRVTLIRADGADLDETTPIDRNAMYAAQDRAFVEASRREASDPRLSSDRDGWRSLVLSDAIRRSSQLRREERVSYEDA